MRIDIEIEQKYSEMLEGEMIRRGCTLKQLIEQLIEEIYNLRKAEGLEGFSGQVPKKRNRLTYEDIDNASREEEKQRQAKIEGQEELYKEYAEILKEIYG